MSNPETAAEFIERMERETGCRVDDNNFDNIAMAGLIGNLARQLGHSNHRSHDDVAAGVVLRHKMSPEGKAQERAGQALAHLLCSDVSPDDLYTLDKALRNPNGS